MTLEIIRKFMLDLLSKYDSKCKGYYDEDGHSGKELLTEIKSFWNNFSTDHDFLYLVSGKYASDDIDLDGGRDYLLSDSTLLTVLFEYITVNLGYSRKDYEDCIHNSVNVTDGLLGMFSTYEVKNDMPKKEDQLEHTNIVLKYPINMKSALDLYHDFTFIGYSKLNGDAIYSVRVPKGYTVINSVEEELNK